MWSPDKYLGTLYRKIRPKFHFDVRHMDEYSRWRDGLRETFARNLGDFLKARPDLNPRVIEEREYRDYFLQRVVYDSDEYLSIPAYILKPKTYPGSCPP